MTHDGRPYRDSTHSGQVLPLFVLVLLVLLGMAALAIDVSTVYSIQQTERSTADSAALAGAQDLQTAGTRGFGDPEAAVRHALANAAGTFGVPVPSSTDCPTVGTPAVHWIVSCPLVGTPYVLTIKTPSPTAVTVQAARAVQVTVTQPDVPLTFARLFGQHDWKVGVTSVAGIRFGAQYAVVTLRGTRPRGPGDANSGNINVSGGTQLYVYSGDVGTNTNVVMNGCGTGTGVFLETGYIIDHFDPTNTSSWCAPIPLEEQIANPIPDPDYTIPIAPSEPSITYTSSGPDGTDTSTNCQTQIDLAIANGYKPANWPTLAAKLPTGLDSTNTTCFKPGVYQYQPFNNSDAQAFLFEPGVYWFEAGLSMHGVLIAGYEAGEPGAAFVFTEGSQCTTGPASHCYATMNNASLFAMNEGSCVASSPIDCSSIALPARDWDPISKTFTGAPIKVTMGISGAPIDVPESLIVSKDPSCVVAAVEPSTCPDGSNNVLNLPGGGNLFVAGVQYAPSDNVSINGNSGGAGRIGQIVAWTLFYTGQSRINEYYPGGPGNGPLRLDTACSGPRTPCNP